jgi:signal peptidase I
MSRRHVAAAALLLAFINSFFYVAIVFTPVRAVSDSMMPTILPGDWVLVRHTTLRHELTWLLKGTSMGDQVPFRVEPGDLVLYSSTSERSASSQGAILKRVAGTPGDTLESRDSSIRINGHALEWSDSVQQPDFAFEWGPVRIPEVGDRFSPVSHSQTPLATGFLERDGTLPTTVRVSTPLYFVIGDNPVYSIDSRDVGLIPENRIQGVARRVLFSKDGDEIRWGRTMQGIGP